MSNIEYTESNKARETKLIRADLCIYGASSAGIAAAIQARRMGLNVVIVESSFHLGGLTTGGLGMTDTGNKAAIGGVAHEFYEALGRYYGGGEADGMQWTFEPSVAKNIYEDWLQSAEVPVYFEKQLDVVEKNGERISCLVMKDGSRYGARIFIDATYEGDLLASAGVSYHVGREANEVYQETLNGVHYGHPNHNFKTWVDPYIVPGKPDSGLIAGVQDVPVLHQGAGDASVQAYNFRICLTNVPDNRLPIPQPPGYDPDAYTLLARYIKAGVWDALRLHKPMPNGKTDLNNFGAVSTDYIGGCDQWPEGDVRTRERLFQDIRRHNMGLLYFLGHDDQIPEAIRNEVGQWGLPADEYPNTGHWTPQLYVREGRRMISSLVMTERHCRGYDQAHDSVGLASYKMDSHNCRRLVIDGRCINEGNVEVPSSAPYPISYRSIVPKEGECDNLLVPICLSTSHIAYGSIRMEPVFMILGQSAATAAALAIEADCTVQDVEYARLRQKLLDDKQVLDWQSC
ncbi:FAD-dependent oxidoreductase [Paenibacillus agaridevorans]|uniref:FAD-dependent oxidoreductase n=1 Tax=Paenibacillus agaridevorans TaxID=171404 RepID=UPI001BE466C7|nr:FAD-dependent oxidoreductase [Paenibacillus agaridevorans]